MVTRLAFQVLEAQTSEMRYCLHFRFLEPGMVMLTISDFACRIFRQQCHSPAGNPGSLAGIPAGILGRAAENLAAVWGGLTGLKC